MTRIVKRIAGVVVALFLAAAFAAPAVADSAISPTDQSAIQALINGQIDAFRHDDGATAYGDASPTIQGMFTDADAFMAMVRNGYQPVYRPQSVIFGDLVEGDSGPQQKVFVTGPDGKAYIAVYTLQQQPDGSWKINGCSLVPTDSPSI